MRCYLDAPRLLLKKIKLALEQLYVRACSHTHKDQVALKLLPALQYGVRHLHEPGH